MKFAQAMKGTRSELSIDIPGCFTEDKKPVVALMRPLTEGEELEVLAKAIEFSKSKGVEKPERGNEIYDATVMVYTIVAGYMDPDSPAEDRVPFFANGAKDILGSFGSDEIGYLFERHEAHQNECSPTIRKVNSEQMMDITRAIAGSVDDGPFVALAPALRARWARILARLYVDSLEDKSLSGSTSQALS